MEEELRIKLKRAEGELETLQQAYDEYIESSTELEHELEHSLQVAEEAMRAAQEGKASLQDRYTDLNNRYKELQRENRELHHSSSQYENQLNGMASVRKVLESKISTLEMKLRISQGSDEAYRKEAEDAKALVAQIKSHSEEAARSSSRQQDELKNQVTMLQNQIHRLTTEWESNHQDRDFRVSRPNTPSSHSDLSTEPFGSSGESSGDEVENIKLKIEGNKKYGNGREGTKKTLTNENKRLNEELECTKRDVERLTAELSDLGEQKSGLIAAQAAQTEAMCQLKREAESVPRLRDELALQSEESRAAHKKSEEYEQALKDLLVRFHTEQQALLSAKEDKAARETDYEELNRALEMSSDEALALTASLQEHKDQAAEEIKELQQQLTEAETKCALVMETSSKQMEELKSEHSPEKPRVASTRGGTGKWKGESLRARCCS